MINFDTTCITKAQNKINRKKSFICISLAAYYIQSVTKSDF